MASVNETVDSKEQLSGNNPQTDESKLEDNPITDERSPVFESRIERATELWDSGKVKFREGKTKEALDDFKRGIYQVDFDELSYNFELMDKHRDAVDKIRIPLWLNAAACLLKDSDGAADELKPKETRMKDAKGALEFCELVIKHDPKHVKALYRRAKAKEVMGETESALDDLEIAHGLVRDDEELSKAVLAMRKRLEKARRESDKMWKGIIKLPEKESVSESSGPLARILGIFTMVWAFIRGLFSGAKLKLS